MPAPEPELCALDVLQISCCGTGRATIERLPMSTSASWDNSHTFLSPSFVSRGSLLSHLFWTSMLDLAATTQRPSPSYLLSLNYRHPFYFCHTTPVYSRTMFPLLCPTALPLTLDIPDSSYSLPADPARQSVGTCIYVMSFLLPGCNSPHQENPYFTFCAFLYFSHFFQVKKSKF